MKTNPHSIEQGAAIVRSAAQHISNQNDNDSLVDIAASAQCVLIGEASHGTHEFYATRADLTRSLITEKGFRAIALEAEWPDTFRVHGMVTAREQAKCAEEAWRDFGRFATWMWRSIGRVEFVKWLW